MKGTKSNTSILTRTRLRKYISSIHSYRKLLTMNLYILATMVIMVTELVHCRPLRHNRHKRSEFLQAPTCYRFKDLNGNIGQISQLSAGEQIQFSKQSRHNELRVQVIQSSNDRLGADIEDAKESIKFAVYKPGATQHSHEFYLKGMCGEDLTLQTMPDEWKIPRDGHFYFEPAHDTANSNRYRWRSFVNWKEPDEDLRGRGCYLKIDPANSIMRVSDELKRPVNTIPNTTLYAGQPAYDIEIEALDSCE